jgi:hypothetical protein
MDGVGGEHWNAMSSAISGCHGHRRAFYQAMEIRQCAS